MSQPQHAVSPLRQRMIEDMNVRKLTEKTQSAYLRGVIKLAAFLKFSPDQATAEDLRRFFVYLSDHGASQATINATISGLRFFFGYTCDNPKVVRKLKGVMLPKKIPVILTPEEVSRLIAATSKAKYRAAFALGYGAGLRINEICHLKVNDIDSQRMLIRVDQGKGHKDRHAMLSESILTFLRLWWKEGHARGRLFKTGWLFPGLNPVNPLSPRQLSRVCRLAADEAEIDKPVTMHALRHSYATHLLEQKVDIRVIQVLLGHSKIETTTRYTQVATNLLKQANSPLDSLTLPT
jgi:integrase/recombinase XerD